MTRIGQRNIVRVQAPAGPKTVVAGTNVSVRAIITYFKHGHPPEDIADGLGIRLSDVFDALAHYYDYREEIEEEIAANDEETVKKLYPPDVINKR